MGAVNAPTNKKTMKTKVFKIYKVTPIGTYSLGEFTREEKEHFMTAAQRALIDMCEMSSHLVVIRGAYSIQVWNEYTHRSMLSYQVEFISDNYRF